MEEKIKQCIKNESDGCIRDKGKLFLQGDHILQGQLVRDSAFYDFTPAGAKVDIGIRQQNDDGCVSKYRRLVR